MKLTDENQDESDCRPLGRKTGVDTEAFKAAFDKAVAAGAAKGDKMADKTDE